MALTMSDKMTPAQLFVSKKVPHEYAVNYRKNEILIETDRFKFAESLHYSLPPALSL
ncbi:MAG: hypothetical protein ACI8VT_002721 [Saprospiraceae bacterium]|jgi:hypothetical protein